MNAKTNYVDIETRQYFHQANLVYMSTLAADLIIIPIIFFTGSMVSFYGNIIGFIIALLAVYLNKKKKYGLSAFLFILTITALGVVQVLLFGLNSGFMYYLFNMSVLIVYTKWRPGLKLVGVITQVVLFVLTFIYAINNPPFYPLAMGWLIFFHILNFVLNITGVANSAYYYIRIANDAQKTLSTLASTDYLTGVNNRVAFDTFMQEKKALFDKNKRTFGLLMIDVDHFKKINDTYGHSCGDDVLVDIATLLKEERGNQDFIARYGGEEFVYVIDAFQANTVHEVAERLRKKVENHTFKYQKQAIKITISIGGIFVNKTCQKPLNGWIECADKHLYQAKDEGRNRVIIGEASDAS
ncbi:MAG: GGDEF domain-containing protein [Acholeplasma sp.]|jgi:diguanylate cyclase (GGDEF)-like protein|nr:GGDEF domain-containing protein [Acholeplasma sp.]